MNKSDDILLKGCLRGDRALQKELYLKYKSSMFGICLRYSKDYSEAQDLLQDGFIQIFKDLHQYKPIGPLGGWMRRVVINVALQHIRRKKKLFSDVDITTLSEKYESDDDIEGDLRAEALLKMVQQLPEGYRTVFNLYVVEGYPHKEIAEKLGISENTSKSQLSRAKAALRKMLEKNFLTA